HGAALLATTEGDYTTARSAWERVLQIRRDTDDQPRTAVTLANLGNVSYELGDLDPAWRLHQEALELHRRLDNRRQAAVALGSLGMVATARGDLPVAREYAEACVAEFRTIGE